MLKRCTIKLTQAFQTILILTGAGIASHATAQPFEQVAVGASHICALDSAGQLDCTTTPIATRFLPPDDLPALTDIVAGQQHSCGITLTGEVQCFGVDAFGVLDVPSFDSPVIDISAGFNHNCAIDSNNQVQCWGLNTNGQLDVPENVEGFVRVDAGATASCGIDLNGDIHCWSTDPVFVLDEPVPGPFVDLDLSFFNACALTANGEIDCFVDSGRLNFAELTNVPYSDLTVTGSAICGLGSDQLLDCAFPDPSDPNSGFANVASEQYPTDIAFSSIERSTLRFGGVPICGIRAESGTISCFGSNGSGSDGSLPAPPGSDSVSDSLNASNITLSLTAQVYSRNQVELFYNQIPSVFPQISVEVFRDDSLLTTTTNGFSFFDNDLSVTEEESQYRIRTVDAQGNIGAFSNTIVVDRIAQTVSLLEDNNGVDNPRPDSTLRVQNVQVTTFSQFVQNDETFILDWTLDNPSSTPIAGFEIRINDEVAGFTANTTFIGDGVSRDGCTVFNVVAIGTDGAILNFGTTAFGRSAITCPR